MNEGMNETAQREPETSSPCNLCAGFSRRDSPHTRTGGRVLLEGGFMRMGGTRAVPRRGTNSVGAVKMWILTSRSGGACYAALLVVMPCCWLTGGAAKDVGDEGIQGWG